MSSWRSRWTELCSSYIYEVCCTSHECVGDLPLFILLLPLLLVSITVYTEVQLTVYEHSQLQVWQVQVQTLVNSLLGNSVIAHRV